MKNSKSGKTKSIVAVVAILSVAVAIGVGGILAYLTDTDTKSNKFTIGNVSITLTEPSWNITDANSNEIPDVAEILTPGQTLAKDPQINNVGSNPAYVYALVKVPTGTVAGTANTELFDLIGLNTTKWTSVATTKTATGYGLHLYKYNTALATSTNTESLFTDVTLKNLTPADMEANNDINEEIIVEAYAIQANGLAEGQDIDNNEMINGLKH